MHEANSIRPLYRGFTKDDYEPVIVNHLAKEGVKKVFFESSREAIEDIGHIYGSTLVVTYLLGL